MVAAGSRFAAITSISFIARLVRCAKRSTNVSRVARAPSISSGIRSDSTCRFTPARVTSCARPVAKHMFDAEFEISIAAKPAARGDVMYVAGCLFRAAGFMTLVLYALNRKFFLNEKGAFAESRRFPIKPARFHETVARILGNIGHTPAELSASVDGFQKIVQEMRALAES